MRLKNFCKITKYQSMVVSYRGLKFHGQINCWENNKSVCGNCQQCDLGGTSPSLGNCGEPSKNG